MKNLAELEDERIFRPKSFINALKRKIRDEEQIDANELIKNIQIDLLSDEEIYEILWLIDYAISSKPEKTSWNRNEYMLFQKYLNEVIGIEKLKLIIQDVRGKVGAILQKRAEFKPKQGIAIEFIEIYKYFTQLINGNSIQKDELMKLAEMFVGLYKVLKNQNKINSEIIGQIGGSLRQVARQSLLKVDPIYIIDIYDKYIQTVCNKT